MSASHKKHSRRSATRSSKLAAPVLEALEERRLMSFYYVSPTGNDNNATNIFVTGDMTHVAGDRYIMIERDDFQGPPTSANPPRQKKLYLFDLNEIDRKTGVLKNRLLVDLLDINDPDDIGGPLVGVPDGTFTFPLQSVESVTPIGDRTLLVGLDNNYPGGNGRVPGTPDATEIITLRSGVRLDELRVTTRPRR